LGKTNYKKTDNVGCERVAESGQVTLLIKDTLRGLDKEEQAAIKRACKIEKATDKTWKQEVLILADIKERQLLLQNQQFLIKNISIEISRIYRENNLKIWPHVPDFLPQKYKLDYSNKTTHQRDVLPEDYSLVDLHKLSQHGVNSVSPNQVSEWEHVTRVLNEQFKKRAEEEGHALMPDRYGSYRSSSRSKKVSVDKPRPHGSLTYDAINRQIKKLIGVRDRVFEFPPEILQKDQEIADGWDTWGTWMDSALDLKYSKSWLDWFKTEKYRDIYGKHAAAVMSFSLSNLCANCSDENTKEWVRMEPVFSNNYETYSCLQCNYVVDTVCPSCNLPMKHSDKPVIAWQCSNCEGSVQISRDLTREQVGDKSSIIVDAAMQILDHIPAQVAFCQWYSEWIEPRISSRKIRLSDELSEKA